MLARTVPIYFWSILLSLPLIVSFFSSTNLQLEVLFLFLVGFALSGINLLLLRSTKWQFCFNVAASLLFCLLYCSIGYPNLIRPDGEVPTEGLILLFGVGITPIFIIVVSKLAAGKNHGGNDTLRNWFIQFWERVLNFEYPSRFSDVTTSTFFKRFVVDFFVVNFVMLTVAIRFKQVLIGSSDVRADLFELALLVLIGGFILEIFCVLIAKLSVWKRP